MTRTQQAIDLSLQLAIQPSPNGRHLASALDPSKPFFWLADTAWELPHRLDREEVELYLRNRAAKGFNVAMIVLFAEHGDGNWPFELSAGTFDLFAPNEEYFEFVDWIVDTAASLGIITALVPTWGRYVNGGYYKGPFLFNDDNAFAFGRYVSNRYPFLPYILGGDSNRFWNAEYRDQVARGVDITTLPLTDYGSITEAFARGLIQGEAPHIARSGVEYKTFITYHSAQVWLPQGPESTGSAQFPDASWLSLDACQSGHYNTAWRPVLPGDKLDNGQTGSVVDDPKLLPHLWRAMSSYVPIRKMYATPRPDGRPRPVLDLEPHYENTHHWFREGHPIWRADNIRRGAWQGIFAGACGYTYGANSIWQMHNDQSKTHPPIQPPVSLLSADLAKRRRPLSRHGISSST
ncbi:hypothetical protein DB88DRAFT_257238 [Papiliotrema laurentii]|uniref:Apiosidase-like catalytic domain-containing protein n=1 Tax=Papiliotrema laurentii TaxID=5418 RepID=A0AAD9FSH4_PAPLA|nr:hypothetical protein DB88DRAFT_257238 [Papiliotrema laurentii]